MSRRARIYGREPSCRDGTSAEVDLSGTIYRVADLNPVH
jgi:hypothetical protein